MKFYIYEIKNNINSKIYIGKTYNPEKRWKRHIYTAKNPTSNNSSFSLIHKAIAKYGSENFSFRIIEEFDSEEEAFQREIFWIKKINTNISNGGLGYNLTSGGEGIFGFKLDENQRKMISLRMKGRFAGDKNPFYGRKHSDETIKKIKEIRKSIDKSKYLGEMCSQSKLKNKDVIEIVDMYKNGINKREIAQKFSVKEKTISSIINGRTWGHITKNILPKKKTKTELIKEINNDVLNGLSNEEICEKYKISKTSLFRFKDKTLKRKKQK